jgi:hypothetical protein
MSIRGHYIETRVYTGDRSSGIIYDPIYVGKVKHARVYEAPYVTIIRLDHVVTSSALQRPGNATTRNIHLYDIYAF